jgi:hypothetical protein
MKIVIPVSEADLGLAIKQSELIKTLGGVSLHNAVLLVAPSISNREEVEQIYRNLNSAFNKVELVRLPSTQVDEVRRINNTSIYQSNQMFQCAVKYLARTNNKEEWFWFEADCTPLKERWADELARDYLSVAAKQEKFLGVRVPRVQYVAQPDGTLTCVIPDVEKEPMMVGAGIYPPRLDLETEEWKYAKSIPFDFALGDFVFPRRGQITAKIVHNHGTKNYATTDGTHFTCKVVGGSPLSKEEITLHAEALVLHGCKDSSVMDFVLDSLKAPKSQEDTKSEKKKTRSTQPND